MTDARFALDFVPARAASLWAAGCQWLQLDAEVPEDLPPPALRPLIVQGSADQAFRLAHRVPLC